jgi:oxygen-independent coproporphyrinogen-3 oxidase
VTLEANPETAGQELLEAVRAAGVNRVSLGVQSFRDEELRSLGRIHSAARARAAVADARAAGFDNISLDLMMWLPGQDVASWLSNVDALIALAPEHASLYLLELYPNAPLRDEMARRGWQMAPDEVAADMYVEGLARLEGAGYRQYEISNVARCGRYARHNTKYWTDGEWLGLGCGAHGTRRGVRWRNVSSTADYIARIARDEDVRAEVRVLSASEALGDAMFMGLRLTGGVDLQAVRERYGCDIMTRFAGALEPFLDADLLRVGGDRLQLTRPGMLLANDVLAVFV